MVGEEQTRVCIPDDDSCLPDWLLVEILVRLPLKSIFNFKAVSKYWFSLISDPSFAHYYESHQINKGCLPSPSKPWVLLLSRSISWQDIGDCIAVNQLPGCDSSGFSLSFLPTKIKHSRMWVVASHNGLLLCCQISDVSYFVCNPLTKHYVALPKPPRWDRGCFDAGFVCQDDGNYKVVRLEKYARPQKGKLKLQIFASETGNWQEINLSNPVFGEPNCRWFNQYPLVPYKGILHWIVCGRSPGFYSDQIIAYDPYRNSHHVHLMDLQSGGNSRHISQCLAVCGDNLCCLETSETPGNESLTLWVLSNYEREEWYLKHEIKHTGDILSDHNSLKTCFFQASRLVVHPFDLDIVYVKCNDVLVSYNFQTRKLELIRSDARFRMARAHVFVSSPWPRLIAQPS